MDLSSGKKIEKKVVIATRESRLALWQAEHVKARLETQLGWQVELLGMTTLGDQILDRSLSKVGGKGLFVKELEVALQEGRADIAVHSLTKFIGGHGTSIGGIVIDSGAFDWTAQPERYPGLTQPDPSYHGVVWTDALGPAAYIGRVRTVMLRNLGAALSPFNAFLFLQGVETLPLRMARHVENTRKVVAFLAGHGSVARVGYPELDGHPSQALARKLLPRGCGSVFSFDMKGSRAQGRAFIEALKIFSHLANVGDCRSLVIHPASTTHFRMDDAALGAAGITPGTIRLSIGLEDADDLIDDLRRALKVAEKAA